MRFLKLVVPLSVLAACIPPGLAQKAEKKARAKAELKSPTTPVIPQKVEFLRDIAPILDKTGCSTAACHGKFGGRGGFQLSLLTLAPEDDYEPIVYGARGRRINFAAPEKSLFVLKSTGQMAHVGGPRFFVNSPEYSLIVRWIRAGAPFENTDPRLTSLDISPKKVMLAKVGLNQPVKVVATYSDGSRRDVTKQTVFESTNTAVLQVSLDGLVTGKRWGGGAVLGRYLGSIVASFITIPQARKGPYPTLAAANVVDRYVFDNLKRMNVLPSSMSSDHEFARRLYLDVLGRLPGPEEIFGFVDDKSPDKRTKLIDALLEKPEYVDFRTMRLADLLRVNPRKFANVGSLGDRCAALFYEWIWKSVAANKPWDQFVKEIITAQGSIYYNGPANFYRIERAPNDRMENVGQAFLGVRMSCARCHKHPFDRWTTDDYWNFAAFCGKVGSRGGRLYDEQVIFRNNGGRVINQSVTGRNRGKVAPATYLGEKVPTPESADMVEGLANWITEPKNPFFARATVNRLWSFYFGKGIIQPVDDMRATTPESVPGLLDALADELVRNKYDIKHVTRLILNSKTYQFSSVPNESNRLDDRFCSHFQPKPMPAQVLLDMIDQAAGVTEQFDSWPEHSRAVQASLPVQNQFLNAFGQSHREFLTDIDPKLEPNLVQTLLMINSPYIEGKIRQGTTTTSVLKDTNSDEELVRSLYLRTFCREPGITERTKALAILGAQAPTKQVTGPNTGGPAAPAAQQPSDPRQAARQAAQDRRDRAQDLLWALITAREFYFNH